MPVAAAIYTLRKLMPLRRMNGSHLLVIAKKHDDATSNDVEASPLFSQDSCNSSARNSSLAAAAAAHLHYLLFSLSFFVERERERES